MQDLGPPTSYLELSSGARVFSCDGQELGRVASVRADPEEDIFDAIVLDASGGRRLVPAEHVEEIFERGVLLKLDAASAAELPPA